MKILFLILFCIVNSHAATRIVVLSDFNKTYGSVSYDHSVNHALDYIAKTTPDLVVSTGDMVAGQKSGLAYQKIWDAFHHLVSILLNNLNTPFAVTPGFHDASGYLRYKNERTIFIEQKI
jgi:predicted MPP superfamily phosphohydrolase